MPTARAPRIADHFDGRSENVAAIYAALLSAARKWGPVEEEPKKTSIHLVRRTAFAGVATRKDALVLTLKSVSDIRSARVSKREQASANRWHLEVRLEKKGDVDRELLAWMKQSYALSD